ncbi:MAG: Gfo/Idh/MocA family oxidoreductase [Planctomycetota bacterium]|nr:Gfo/Idh/MocA family oxidoreductase [Planctomycetota bacterium]
MTRELRAAVVGVGTFGRHHARVYRELEQQRGLGADEANVRLVGLVDIDLDGPKPVADRLQVPLVGSLDELPEMPDIVSVAVPTSVHRRVAEPLLRSGVSCLVEKPVAGSTSDARALVGAAEAGGAQMQVGLLERFNPVTAAIDKLGSPPQYIEVHRLAPFAGRAMDVGVVMDMMIHDLDLVSHIVNEEPVDVQAVGVSLASDYEDVANVRITFPSGCVANVTASRVAQQRMRRTRIFSHHAYLSLDYDRREARIVRRRQRAEDWSALFAELAARGADLEPGRVNGAGPDFESLLQTERVPISDSEPLREEILALLCAVRTGRRPVVGGMEGLRALRLAERVLADIRGRQPARG